MSLVTGRKEAGRLRLANTSSSHLRLCGCCVANNVCMGSCGDQDGQWMLLQLVDGCYIGSNSTLELAAGSVVTRIKPNVAKRSIPTLDWGVDYYELI